MRFVLAAGSTKTARIEGISAAGATPELMTQTPAIDAEILTYGQPVSSELVPVSPTGCPTPAVISRAIREQVGFDTTVLDAGLAAETDAPTVSVGADPGRDIRENRAVPGTEAVFERSRRLGRSLPDDELFVAETIPGGTTTAAALLRALGTDLGVSSSLPENPLALKERVVTAGFDASGIDPGGLADAPLAAIEAVGDPVQATVTGLTVGALESGSSVTLAGGTQLVATAGLVRAIGREEPLALATTAFVAADPAVDLDAAAATLDLDVSVTDPGFARTEHVAMQRYVAGEAKEGVGMGGALALAEREGIGMGTVRDRIAVVYDRLDPAAISESKRATDGGGR